MDPATVPWFDALPEGSGADRFSDRTAAGRVLADALQAYAGRSDVVVLGLPRGGVPVAHALASRLGARLDVFVVRKLGVPGHEELAFGALASGGVRVLNHELVEQLELPEVIIGEVSRREQGELHAREELYRAARPAMELAGRTVILVDDGLATGSTMRAAIAAVRAHEPATVVVAVPLAPMDTCARLRSEADEVVCLRTPEPFQAVGLWYEDFSPVTDEQVRQLLLKR